MKQQGLVIKRMGSYRLLHFQFLRPPDLRNKTNKSQKLQKKQLKISPHVYQSTT